MISPTRVAKIHLGEVSKDSLRKTFKDKLKKFFSSEEIEQMLKALLHGGMLRESEPSTITKTSPAQAIKDFFGLMKNKSYKPVDEKVKEMMKDPEGKRDLSELLMEVERQMHTYVSPEGKTVQIYS